MSMKKNIHKLLASCVMICAFASCLSAEEFTPGDVIVVLKPGSSRVTVSSMNGAGGVDSLRLASFAAESGAYVVNSYKTLSEQTNSVYALIHSDLKSPDRLVKELLNNPEVIAASPNYIVRASATTPNDPRYNDLWGMKYINAPEAWDVSTGSNNIYAAVVDTGIDWTNPDLTDNVDTSLARNFVSSASSAIDDNGHGTHVAGIIGAKGNNSIGVTGVSWNVKLIPVKVLNWNGTGNISDVIKGIEYVIYLVNQGYNVVAMNMSLEFYSSTSPTQSNLTAEPLWRACKQLDNLNSTLITAAAGNFEAVVGQPTTKTMYDKARTKVYDPGEYVYPASFRGINNFISVSAIDSNGSLADFTNTNATMNAPGVNILSTYLQNSSSSGGVSLTTLDGTSMASPHVAGAAAVLAAAMPGRTAFQYKCALLGITGDSDSASESTGKELDLAYAIDYQENHAIDRKGTRWDSEFNSDNDTNADKDPDAYDPDEYNNNNNNTSPVTGGSGGGGGGCDSFTMSFAGIMMLCPLFFRRKNNHGL